MKQVDEIFYDALMADTALKTACGYKAPTQSDPGAPARIKSTCFEVAPSADDNTPLPFIIVMDDGFTNSNETKDDVWESTQDDHVVSVEVSAKSPKAVDTLVDMVRKAIGRYIITSLTEDERPQLTSVQSNGKAWDWTKPCYHSTITYRCSTNYDNEYEQEPEK